MTRNKLKILNKKQLVVLILFLLLSAILYLDAPTVVRLGKNASGQIIIRQIVQDETPIAGILLLWMFAGVFVYFLRDRKTKIQEGLESGD